MQARMLEIVSTQNDILAKLKLMVESVSGIAARGTADSHSDDGVQGEHCAYLEYPVYHCIGVHEPMNVCQ